MTTAKGSYLINVLKQRRHPRGMALRQALIDGQGAFAEIVFERDESLATTSCGSHTVDAFGFKKGDYPLLDEYR